MKTALVIFCDDFRIRDNPALFHAVQNYKNVIPLYIYDKNYCGREIGAAAKVFLHQILHNFSKLLFKKCGAKLIIRHGNFLTELKKIAAQTDFEAIYFNNSYLASQVKNENEIKNIFKDKDVKSFKAKLLFEPWEIKTGAKSFFKVFTPFSKECLKKVELIGKTLDEVSKFSSRHNLKTLEIEELKLLPKNQGRWHEKILQYWEFDYQKIEENIIDFIDTKLANYAEARNVPSLDGTSKLSPYLRFGVFSPRIIYYSAAPAANSGQFILELLWREFAFHVTYFNPKISTKELKPHYGAFEWNDDKNFLKKWQKGKTGFSFVDAGMHELWATGFMHNRVRMVTASFLVKNLMIDWRLGEEWFYECLVDACPAVNPFSWQWVFGSGFDAAPYFRIFNPELQRERFDAQKLYCQKWLGKNYEEKEVKKIINYNLMRKVALEKFKKLKELKVEVEM